MIYYGNIAQNWHNANASGNHKMKRDILLSEIAKIIVGNPALVNKHLVDSGFKPGGTNINKLSDTVSDALKKSPKFATKMAYEIIGGNYGATGAASSDSVQPVATEPVPQQTTTTETATTTSSPTSTTSSASTTSGATTSSPNVTATTAPIASPAPPPSVSNPIVYVLGQTFGGLNSVTSGSPAITYGKTSDGGSSGGSGGGGGGDMGGGGGGGGSPADELKAKANSIAGKNGISRNMKIAFTIVALTGLGIGAWYYFK